ncbi:hypothetical protein [Nonomuraea gerenzanensis]|uniref:hypothetical protein n=1 Tax=Nonomuraea gerenzanensis TaxID=93944 RepID=UPI001CDA1D32|nr:hypothetical protein [Nonomuraea gerenzanensis]UBU18598.1 hypothetical protein LCN96_27320 [Nonomuraea gerenzanensis]
MRTFPRWLRWSGALLLSAAVMGAGAFLYGQSLEDADRYASVGSLAIGAASLVLTLVAMIRQHRAPDPPPEPAIRQITVNGESTVVVEPHAPVYLSSTRYYGSVREGGSAGEEPPASPPKGAGRWAAFFRRRR